MRRDPTPASMCASSTTSNGPISHFRPASIISRYLAAISELYSLKMRLWRLAAASFIASESLRFKSRICIRKAQDNELKIAYKITRAVLYCVSNNRQKTKTNMLQNFTLSNQAPI